MSDLLTSTDIIYKYRLNAKTVRTTIFSPTNIIAFIEGIFTWLIFSIAIYMIYPYLQSEPYNISPISNGILMIIFGMPGAIFGGIIFWKISDHYGNKYIKWRVLLIIFSIIPLNILTYLNNMQFSHVHFTVTHVGANYRSTSLNISISQLIIVQFQFDNLRFSQFTKSKFTWNQLVFKINASYSILRLVTQWPNYQHDLVTYLSNNAVRVRYLIVISQLYLKGVVTELYRQGLCTHTANTDDTCTQITTDNSVIM